MRIRLTNEELSDSDFINAVEEELTEGEKLCKKFGYDCDFYLDTSRGLIQCDVYPKKEFYPKIYMDFNYGEFNISIQTTSYGPLDLDNEVDGYFPFMNGVNNAYKFANELKRTFYLISQLGE